jgi:uncharacterized protein (TIGR00730 family)
MPEDTHTQDKQIQDEPILDSDSKDLLPSPHEAREQVSPQLRHHAMGHILTSAIEEGKHSVPVVPDPLVTKPNQLESWRVFKIMSEFVEGFDLIRKYTLAASIFGSARHTFDEKVYQDATDLAGRLAKEGFAIITGGSAGIMEAANKGAFEAGGASVGLNVRLADNQQTNKYVTDTMTFDHFFVRKVMLTFASGVYIYFPGGFGTFDEFGEILTLVQTKNIKRVPIVLFGKEYWTPIITLFKEHLYEKYKTIDKEDLELYCIVDSVDEAFEYIMKNVAR